MTAVESELRTLAELDDTELAGLDAWWRANNYLTIGQIYLQGNPLLREPLSAEHIKPRLLGHWGTSPGLSFIYAHVSRLIRHTGQQAIYLAGPGHGGPALVAAGYLEGTYTEIYPDVTPGRGRDAAAVPAVLQPGRHPEPRVGDHARARSTRAASSGYVLVHAFGAVMDNPDLLAIAVVGDGEAETGPARGLLEGRLLPQPRTRRRRPADPAPQRRQDLRADRARAQGPRRRYAACSRATATTSSRSRAPTCPACTTASPPRSPTAWTRIRDIQTAARDGAWDGARPHWPLIVLRSPKGWTGPDAVDGVTGHRHVALAPGAAVRRQGQPGAPRAARALAAGRTVRRSCSTPTGAPVGAGPGPGPRRRPADERQPARQRRPAHPGPRPAGLPRLRDRGAPAGAAAGRVDPQAGRDDARHLHAQPRPVPAVLPGRDQQQPARRRLRGLRPRLHGAGDTGGRGDLPRRPGDGGASASTTATAGWRATP